MTLFNPIGPNQITTSMIAPGAITLAQTNFNTVPLPVSAGGNGTASPGITAGTGIVVTGTWPTQQVAT